MSKLLWHTCRGGNSTGRSCAPVAGEGAGVEDGEVGRPELREVLLARPDQHVVHEHAVVRPRAHHPDLAPRLQNGTWRSVGIRAAGSLNQGLGPQTKTWVTTCAAKTGQHHNTNPLLGPTGSRLRRPLYEYRSLAAQHTLEIAFSDTPPNTP